MPCQSSPAERPILLDSQKVGIEHRRRRRVSSEARRRHTKTRSALRTPTWWIQEPGAAVPPGDVTIDALPSTTVRVPRRFRWTLGVLRRTDESYEGAVSPPRRLSTRRRSAANEFSPSDAPRWAVHADRSPADEFARLHEGHNARATSRTSGAGAARASRTGPRGSTRTTRARRRRACSTTGSSSAGRPRRTTCRGPSTTGRSPRTGTTSGA